MKGIDQLKHRSTAKVLERYIEVLRRWMICYASGRIHNEHAWHEELLTDLRGYFLTRKDGSPELLLLAEQKCVKDLPVAISDDQMNMILVKMVAQAERSMNLYGIYLDLND